MKKAFIFLSIIVSLFFLSSCSEDFTSKLGSFMGGMESNIYGIGPDLRKAKESAAMVKSSITMDEDGDLSIDYRKVASIADTIGEIMESPQKAKALNDLLSAEVPADEAVAIRENLNEKIEELKTTIGTVDHDDPLAGVKNTLLNALAVSASGNTPVFSEVVMVSLLDRMVGAVTVDGADPEVFSAIGRKAVDTIKVVAKISTLDILADINITGLVSSLADRSVSREGEGVNPIAANLFGKTISKIVDMISTDKDFDDDKYEKFILQAQTLAAAYEMVCAYYLPEDWSEESILNLAATHIDKGLTIEDFVLYLVLKINNALETYSGGVWGDLLSIYMFTGDNYEIFSDFEHATKRPESPAELFSGMLMHIVQENEIGDVEKIDFDDIGEDMASEIMDHSVDYQAAIDAALAGIVGEEFKFKDMLHDFGDVLRGIKTDVNENAMKFAIGFKDTMFTSVIMIMDAEYESVFNFLAEVLEPLLKRHADELTTDL